MLTNVNGNGFAFPSLPWAGPISTLNSQSLTASDATQKIAFIGQIYNKDFASKNIQSVKFRTNALTSWGVGSVLTVSLQGLGSTGAPVVPNESIDQSFTLIGVALTANAWNGANLGANRSINFGDRVAVVFQISTFTAADSIQIATRKTPGALEFDFPCVSKKNTTWATTTDVPNVIFGFDDGTFGTLQGCRPLLNRQSNQFTSSASPNEYALHIVMPFSCKVYGAWLEMSHDTSTSTSTLSLYDSNNNVLASKNLDQSWFQNLTTQRFTFISFGSEVSLTAGSTYRLGLSATANFNLTLAKETVNSANDFQCFDNSINCYLDSRTGSGAWSATTASRPSMGLLISRLDNGVFSRVQPFHGF